jgi:hypothetical protein
MPVMQNYAGRTFGRITLFELVPGKSGYWKGTCSCGNPVEKRIDNLKRPGDHSCGKCLPPVPTADANLEERVRRLEQIVASGQPGLLTRPVTESEPSLISSVASEVSEAPTPELQPQTSQFSSVTHDGEFWQARSLSGKVLCWADTEEEAAFAARVYLELTHNTFNRRVITDAELTLPAERCEQIRDEVIAAL